MNDAFSLSIFGSYHCLWNLACCWHDRRWLAFGLDAHRTTSRHCRYDQPLSGDSRSQSCEILKYRQLIAALATIWNLLGH